MRIRLLNWEKWNPRADVKHPGWFRLDREFYLDGLMQTLPVPTRFTWVVLMAMCTRGRGVVDITPPTLSRYCGTTTSSLLRSLYALQDAGKIAIEDETRNAHVPRRDGDTGRDETGRDRTRHYTVDLAVAGEWLELARQEMPWKAHDPGWTIGRFAEAIAKVKKATDLNDDGIRAVLAFVKDDEFWRKNAPTPLGLLKKSARNGERKIDNILIRMRTRTKTERAVDAATEWVKQKERESDGNAS